MFTKLLIPLDGSSLAEQALAPAAAIARATHAGTELALVHQPMAFAEFTDAAWQSYPSSSERAYVESTAKELAAGASIAASGVALRGPASETICEHAKAIGADMIVMTTHGRTGVSRAWLGSVAHDVLRQSTIPVLMLRPVDRQVRRVGQSRIKKILVTLDGSAYAESILEPAAALARAFGARLILLRVVAPVPMIVPEPTLPVSDATLLRDEAATAELVDDATRQLARVVASLTDAAPIRVETHVVVAERVAKAILEFARSVSPSIIAMSTHGRGASRLFLGSVADKVLRGATAAMLLRRPVTVRQEAPLLDAESVREQLPALCGV